MGLGPEYGNFTLGMTATERMPPDGLGWALIQGPLLPDGRAPHIRSEEKV